MNSKLQKGRFQEVKKEIGHGKEEEQRIVQQYSHLLEGLFFKVWSFFFFLVQ